MHATQKDTRRGRLRTPHLGHSGGERLLLADVLHAEVRHVRHAVDTGEVRAAELGSQRGTGELRVRGRVGGDGRYVVLNAQRLKHRHLVFRKVLRRVVP